jgi:hypothetical protein
MQSPSHQPASASYWITAAIATCGVMLFGALTLNPQAARWVSDAAQAEFASAVFTPEQAPVQLAQPGYMRTVRAE